MLDPFSQVYASVANALEASARLQERGITLYRYDETLQPVIERPAASDGPLLRLLPTNASANRIRTNSDFREVGFVITMQFLCFDERLALQSFILYMDMLAAIDSTGVCLGVDEFVLGYDLSPWQMAEIVAEDGDPGWQFSSDLVISMTIPNMR